jgi:uncharacterized membrane protein
MNLVLQDAPTGLALAGWLVLAPCAGLAVRAVRHGFIPRGMAEHAWLGGAVALSMLWRLQVDVGGAPAFGMIGAALYALMFGCARGLLGVLLALVLHVALNAGSWLNLGLNGILLAVLPSALVTLLRQQIDRRLPANPFVFMIGNGLFATLLATAVTHAAILGVTLLAQPYRGTVSLGDYLTATLLMAWSEALVSGMLLSALVVYLPQVVLTFRGERYARRSY